MNQEQDVAAKLAPRNRTQALVVCMLLFCLSSCVHQLPANCPTARSRLDLLHAVAEGRVSIDVYEANTPDKAEHENHFYSDKAPGTVAIALPAFLTSGIALERLGISLDSEVGWLVSSWAACAGSIGILTALGAACIFQWLSRYVAGRPALAATLALFLGAAPLPYATMLFSHSLVVGLICIALWAIHKAPPDAERSRVGGRRWNMLAGFCCGWALASEYTAGLVVVGLFALLVSKGRRRALPFCLSAIPPLLLVPLYSFICFGNPFILPYSLNESFPAMKEGLYAIRWPDPETACNLLFSPTRGLFFWTPFLAMAGAGYLHLARSDVRLFWFTYAVPLLQVVVISGRVWDWQAGPTLGPRYLAPILPLLALPCALGVRRFPRLGIGLAAYSILITTLATLTNASPPASYYNPLTELHIPLLAKGELAPNLGVLMGLPPHASVVLYYAFLVGGVFWLWRHLPAQPAVTEGNHTRDRNPIC